jgi:hypothetical protein
MQRPHVFASAAVAIGLFLSSSVVALGAPSNQVAPSAPDNLRCQLSKAPEPPGPGWQVVPVWEWRELYRVDSPTGSSDGPYAVAVDRDCNIYLTDAEHFQILKLDRGGAMMQRLTMPGDRAPGESSSRMAWPSMPR